MLYALCIHLVYILYASYIHGIHKIYVFYTLFKHLLDMPRTSFAGRFFFSPKSVGDVWAIIWHHRRCLRRGGKIINIFFPKKMVQDYAKWPPDENAILKIFRFLFSSWFMHFLFFSYFQFFPSRSLYIYTFWAPKGPLASLNFFPSTVLLSNCYDVGDFLSDVGLFRALLQPSWLKSLISSYHEILC